MARETVAAVIPTKNVAHIMRPTLDALGFCDEVIVVDMFSTDDTRQVCESYPNVRFVQRQGYIYDNFNFGVDQATTDWILRIDSDEVVSPELRQAILEVLEGRGEPGVECYSAAEHLHMFGFRMRHGYGSKVWRHTLFRKGAARYLARSEHEDLHSDQPWLPLRGHYDHFTSPTLSDFVRKIDYYTERDVERWPAERGKVLGAVGMLRQVLVWWLRFYIHPYKAHRDGMPGFAVSVIGAFSIILLELKKWEKAATLERAESG